MPVDLSSLNPEQRLAAETTEGPLLVLAGAGSGKTRVITYRIAHLLDRGVDPRKILGVTFTNKAAREMRERLARMTGEGRARQVVLSTFHALGARLLRDHGKPLGLKRDFGIADVGDQCDILRALVRSQGLDHRKWDVYELVSRISRWKGLYGKPAHVKKVIGDYDRAALELWEYYDDALRGQEMVDFEDLLLLPVQLLSDEDAGLRIREKYDYVLVDEYQDTNSGQFRLLKGLVERTGNCCVVGDDDQSIYGWRGAEVGHILSFQRQFPGAKIVRLESNYRSTRNILDAANAVISRLPDRHEKQLRTVREAGVPVEILEFPSAEAEADQIASEIQQAIARGTPPHEVAVLYRTNQQSRPLEQSLRLSRIPYRVLGGESFFERREVKDALGYLKCALRPKDNLSFLRVVNYPARGVGKQALDLIREESGRTGECYQDAARRLLASGNFTPGQSAGLQSFFGILDGARSAFDRKERVAPVLERMLMESGLRSEIDREYKDPAQRQVRHNVLDELIKSLPEGEDPRDAVVRLLEETALEKKDTDDGRMGCVTLLSIHSAKGLEFSVVFLAGVEEGLLPHIKSTQAGDGVRSDHQNVDTAEERRLFYVAITRAKDRLVLTRACERERYGKVFPTVASRFLADIPAALVADRRAEMRQIADERRKTAAADLIRRFSQPVPPDGR
ncbi:MAG: UvrD-helicase domain-containing protein [Deltaproteobacteria bacterium]|nr:UvrD-helicase domain-containing protein [Deltaproteobacteria bacterium]